MSELGILCPKRTKKWKKSWCNFNERAKKKRRRDEEKNWDNNPLPSPKELLALRKRVELEKKKAANAITAAIIKRQENEKKKRLSQTAPKKASATAHIQPVQKTVAPPPPQKNIVVKIDDAPNILHIFIKKILSWLPRKYPQQKETA